MMIYSVKGLAMLAVAVGVGYAVCVLAAKEKGLLKTVGYLIGALIIVACLGGAILRICAGGGLPACPIFK